MSEREREREGENERERERGGERERDCTKQVIRVKYIKHSTKCVHLIIIILSFCTCILSFGHIV